MKERLAEVIRQWMWDNDMTQAETAVFLETTQPRVSLIKRNQVGTISLEMMVAYVTRLGYTVDLNITVQ